MEPQAILLENGVPKGAVIVLLCFETVRPHLDYCSRSHALRVVEPKRDLKSYYIWNNQRRW